MSQVAFLLFSLLRQNVTFVSVLTLDFTGSGKRETLFCTGVRFYLWHFVIKYLIVNNSSDRQPSRSIPSYTSSSTAWLKVLGVARSPHRKHLRWFTLGAPKHWAPKLKVGLRAVVYVVTLSTLPRDTLDPILSR